MALDLVSVLLFIVVFLLSYFFLKNKDNPLPPGLSKIPLIGNFLWVSKYRRSAKALFEKSDKLGKVISLQTVFSNTVVIHGYDLIHDTFVKRADEFSFRPSWLNLVKKRTKRGKGMVWRDGADWRSMRRFALQSLREFGVGKTSLEEKIMAEVEAATNVLTETGGKPCDVSPITKKMIFNIIYGIVFGRRLEYNDDRCTTTLHHLQTLFKGEDFTSSILFPDQVLKLISKEKYDQRIKREESVQWLRDHVSKEIKEHEITFDEENIRDFIDIYIQNKRKAENGEEFNYTDADLFQLILELFIAGSETTSNTVNWSILYAMEYPEMQKKCQEDIEKVCGQRAVRYADRTSLPFVEATLLEIQRMSNIAGLSLPHANIEDTMIGGYFVPKRSLVFANLLSSNMDPKYWVTPEVFNPARFIENGKLKKNPALIPFSTGPRICPGESLAKMEMFLIFANVISRFTFTREDENVPHSFECDPVLSTSSPLAYRTRANQKI